MVLRIDPNIWSVIGTYSPYEEIEEEKILDLLRFYPIRYRNSILNCIGENNRLITYLDKFHLSSLALRDAYTRMRDDSFQQVDVYETAIFLGSSLEGALQLYLLAFQIDYKNDQSSWNDEDVDAIRDLIEDLFSKMRDQKVLNKKRRGNLKEDFFKCLDCRGGKRNIEDLRLGGLVGYFRTRDLFFIESGRGESQEETKKWFYDRAADINDYRNNIHMTTKHVIPAKEEAMKLVNLYCRMLDHMLSGVESLIPEEKNYIPICFEKGDKEWVMLPIES